MEWTQRRQKDAEKKGGGLQRFMVFPNGRVKRGGRDLLCRFVDQSVLFPNV